MEIIALYLLFVGTLTTIAAIDESIDWMTSYRRAGEESHQHTGIDSNSDYGIYYHE